MSWTDRADNAPCCEGPLGVVEADETVARILNSRTVEPDQAAFTRRDLHGDGLTDVSDICGDADGLSVDRNKLLSDEDLRARSEKQAAQREGRVAAGAVVALVKDLRSIRHEALPDGQAVFVYDDPRPDNDHHAVVRVSQKVPRTDFKLVQREVIRAFGTRVA